MVQALGLDVIGQFGFFATETSQLLFLLIYLLIQFTLGAQTRYNRAYRPGQGGDYDDQRQGNFRLPAHKVMEGNGGSVGQGKDNNRDHQHQDKNQTPLHVSDNKRLSPGKQDEEPDMINCVRIK